MPYYKNANNGLVFIDDAHAAEFEKNLPSGFFKISIAEAEATIASNTPAAPAPYVLQRARAYPPMADYLDGVVKGDQAQINAYIAACLAVKAKFPKT